MKFLDKETREFEYNCDDCNELITTFWVKQIQNNKGEWLDYCDDCAAPYLYFSKVHEVFRSKYK